MIKIFLHACVASLTLVFSFATSVSAQTAPAELDFPNVKIENFGQMDERFYRGAQPSAEDFQALKDLGVKTVINLRDEPKEYEKSTVESLGMKYVHIPMSGWKTPKQKSIDEFLKVVNDPETGVFFVHCKAGIHRTGVVGAVYRYTKYSWDYEQVYKEMKNYNFFSGWFHGPLKSYVKNYVKEMQPQKMQASVLQEAVQTGQ
jgi:protein tyrosine/serine phosphatase